MVKTIFCYLVPNLNYKGGGGHCFSSMWTDYTSKCLNSFCLYLHYNTCMLYTLNFIGAYANTYTGMGITSVLAIFVEKGGV